MKLLFYFENRWVFGKIHNELIKVLYPEIYCDILDASIEINSDKMALFLNKYDFIVTTPWAGICVLHKMGGIPLNRIIAIAHGDLDIEATFRDGGTGEDFNNLAGYGVVSESVFKYSKSKKINRSPKILRVGLFTELYSKPISKKIKTLGYVGSFYRVENGIDIKRGHLAQKIAEKCGLNFKHITGINFLTVEQMYNDLDLVMFCSLTEGNPYSAMEALACGIPVLGTDTGNFAKMINKNGGFILPTDETKFVNTAYKMIKKLEENYEAYKMHSIIAKMQSRIFDWSNFRHEWINYFLSLESKK